MDAQEDARGDAKAPRGPSRLASLAQIGELARWLGLKPYTVFLLRKFKAQAKRGTFHEANQTH